MKNNLKNRTEFLTIEETLSLNLALLPDQAWEIAVKAAPLMNNRIELDIMISRLKSVDPIVASVIKDFYLKLRVMGAYRLDIEEEFKQAYLARVKKYRYDSTMTEVKPSISTS